MARDHPSASYYGHPSVEWEVATELEEERAEFFDLPSFADLSSARLIRATLP